MPVPDAIGPETAAFGGDVPDYKTMEQGIHEKMGQNLRIVRRQLGKSRDELAKMAGISLSQYRRYEECRDLPTLYSALNWSVGTGVPTHWLFTDTGYNDFVDVEIQSAWIPIIHFANWASDSALSAFQTAVEGLVGGEKRERLESYKAPSLEDCRQNIAGDYFTTLSEHLRNFRRMAAVSQDTMAYQLGISTAAYKRYEVPGRINRFGIHLIMRFWVATRISPLKLTCHSQVFAYRQQQNRNFAILLPLLASLTPGQLERVKALAAVLSTMNPASGRCCDARRTCLLTEH